MPLIQTDTPQLLDVSSSVQDTVVDGQVHSKENKTGPSPSKVKLINPLFAVTGEVCISVKTSGFQDFRTEHAWGHQYMGKVPGNPAEVEKYFQGV
ncbi:hypothetical protein Y1Q_0012687 [Alligator mississippiensis]|uniref:Uncharacterized protein n=1 Tax=Alligator mississippiensis TaxID=8496 RepID=A0A151M8K0_ALLMI|nr:hypothetical protein Y1Q_0012687 [Alligator mississippiensis]